jgi:N-acetylmuramic acid 6-phosphate etherase
MGGKAPEERARDFLRVAHLYRLGILPTEQPHPRTAGLSRWAQHDLPHAVEVLKSIDVEALATLQSQAGQIDRLAAAIQATLAGGGRIFLCGCGATGRLSLSLEFLWRQGNGNGHRDQVRAFMAGGDVALVHALEGFEDHPAYGARHVEQMGFTDGDLLISCTEGGETPYVIGATERAAEISSNAPYFLYCNADSILAAHIERFQRVFDNKGVNTICLDVGPMALAGSTRMQASTVLQIAVGSALLHPQESADALIKAYADHVAKTDFSFLPEFITTEAGIYAADQHLTYRVRDYGITVLTDTTERAPTFSLVPFDQLKERLPVHSLCYVSLDDAADPEDAWSRLLNRRPHSLDWPDVDARTTPQYLRGFDFSALAPARRRRQIPDRAHQEFHIRRTGKRMEFRLQELAHTLPVNDLPELHQHLLLKQILNIHSTLVMGRLGRYESNLMTWVSPTNGKLVDRAVRYVQHLLAGAGQTDRSYEDIVRRLFTEMDAAAPGESVVLRTYRSLLSRTRYRSIA